MSRSLLHILLHALWLLHANGTARAADALDRCVDAMGLFNFYNYPEWMRDEKAAELRELVRQHFPDLPAIRGGLRPEAAEKHNATMLTRLQQAAGGVDTALAMTEARAQQLLNEVATHPVASVEKLPKYDPSGRIGFCFGRACAVHWIAGRNYGVPDSAVRKAFIVGELRSRTGESWKFHAGTMIRGDNPEGWWVIDPLVGRPVTPSQWLRHWTRDHAREVEDSPLLFVTSPDQLLHDPSATLPRLLDRPDLGPFFRDLRDSIPK